MPSHKNRDETDIAVILLGVAAEAAMDDLIWDMLSCKLDLMPCDVNAVMAKITSRKNRLALFEKQTGISAYDAMKDHGKTHTFMRDWDILAGQRNEVAHARCFDYRSEDAGTGKRINLLVPIRRFRETFFDGFATLTNWVYR